MGQHAEVLRGYVGGDQVRTLRPETLETPETLVADPAKRACLRVSRGCAQTDSDERCCRNMQVPTLEKDWGTGMLVVNILLPGVGTLVAGIKSERNTTMVIGVLQFLLAFVIVGWIWSIYWGWLIYKKVIQETLSSSTTPHSIFI